MQRLPCGISGKNDACVVLEVPLKRQVQNDGADSRTMTDGRARIELDLATGLVLALRTAEMIETQHSSYQADTKYSLKRMQYGGRENAALFKLPSGNLREVKDCRHFGQRGAQHCGEVPE